MKIRPPDQQQRDQIENDLHRNLIVEASAGTGKTESMSTRIANLLLTGSAQVQEVAAITFTRKAAAELRGRLRQTLERRYAKSSIGEQERAQIALQRLESMFIGTVHSFCNRLLQEYPVEAGLSPGFRELDSVSEQRLMAESFRHTVDNIRHEDPRLFRELTRGGVMANDLLPSLKIVCAQQDVEYSHESPPPPDYSFATMNILSFIEEMQVLVGSDIPPETTCKLHQSWQHLTHACLFLSPDEPLTVVRCMELWKSNITCRKKWWAANFEEARELAMDFARQWAEPFMRQWRSYLYGLVLEVLNRARSDFQDRRLRTAQLNFDDQLGLAARLLRKNLSVRRKLQEKFLWLFVDEFQDTDPLQAEIVCLLASRFEYQGPDWTEAPLRPGALFVVGDPKQSIYRFRRADLDVNALVSERIRLSGGAKVTLTASFRSIPALCEWSNTVFSTLLPEEAEPGQAAFSPLLPVRNGSDKALEGVFTLTDYGSDYKQVSEREAESLAGLIGTAVHEQGYSWGDFLILTMRRNDVATYSRELEEACIPVEVTGGASSTADSVIALEQLLRVLTDPEDSVSLVGLLRGPLFGLDDEALYRHKARGGVFHYLSPSDDGLGLVLGALADLREMRNWIVQLPVGAAVNKILDHTGLLALACTANHGDGEAPDLLHYAEQIRQLSADGRSLAQALDLLELQEKSYPIALNAGRRDVVRVMNLHQSKGLQARVVVLASPTSGLAERVHQRVVREEGGARGYLSVRRGYSLLAEPHDWDEHQSQELAFLRFERTRLLYVAATRARDALIVSRWSGTNKRPNRPWEPLEAFLEDVTELPLSSGQRNRETTPLELSQAEQAVLDLRARWAECLQPGWVRTSVTVAGQEKQEIPLPKQLSEYGADSGTAWGNLIHRLMEFAAKNPKATPEQFQRMAHWFIYDEPELVELVPLAVHTVEQVLQSEFWETVRSADCQLTEVPFGTALQEGAQLTLVFGVVDLALQKGRDWSLVDYKTDHKQMDRLEQSYSRQLKDYARYWAGLTDSEPSAQLFRVRSAELSGDLTDES